MLRIRLLDPDKKNWRPIIKKTKYYYITRKDTPSSTFFVTLDVGERGGFMMIRGVPSKTKKKVGDQVESADFHTQAFRVEYSDLGVSSGDSQAKKIKALKDSVFWGYIKKTVKREQGWDDIDVEGKGKDLQIIKKSKRKAGV